MLDWKLFVNTEFQKLHTEIQKFWNNAPCQLVLLPTFRRYRMPSTSVQVSDVLLTVHLSIFILVINQLGAQNLFYNKFISCLYMFRALCAHRQEVKIVLYSLWYHHTYRCGNNRGCIIQYL